MEYNGNWRPVMYVNNGKWITTSGKDINIKAFIGEDFEGKYYDAEYEGKSCTLLVLRDRWLKIDSQIERNWSCLLSCELHDFFLAPIEFVHYIDTSDLFNEEEWGILLEKVSGNMLPIAALWDNDISKRVVFADVELMYKTCLNICRAMRAAHYRGFVFRGDVYNNIYFDSKSGVIKISSILLTPNNNTLIKKELAKEWCPSFSIHDQYFEPCLEADEYILAIIIYRIILICHPMEGKKCLNILGGPNAILSLRWRLPQTYTFDPNDDSNRPIYFWGSDALARQDLVPNTVKELFEKTFVHGMTEPRYLAPDIEWVEKLESLIQKINSDEKIHKELNRDISLYSNRRTLIVKSGRYEQKFRDWEGFAGVTPGKFRSAVFFTNEEVNRRILIYGDYAIALTEDEDNTLTNFFDKSYFWSDIPRDFLEDEENEDPTENILPFEMLLDNDEVITLPTIKVDVIDEYFAGLAEKHSITVNITYALELAGDSFYMRINFIERLNKYLISLKKELFSGHQGWREYCINIRDLFTLNQIQIKSIDEVGEIVTEALKKFQSTDKFAIRIWSYNAESKNIESDRSYNPVELGIIGDILKNIKDSKYCRNVIEQYNLKEVRKNNNDPFHYFSFDSDGFV